MAKLSKRQAEIVTMLVQGKSQKAAARQLGVSYSTVRNHLRAARERTDSQSTLQLAMRAAGEIKK